MSTAPILDAARAWWAQDPDGVTRDELAALIAEARQRGSEIELIRNGSRGLFWLEPLLEVVTPGGRLAYGPVTASAEYKAMEEVIRAVPISADIRLGEVCAWSTRGLPWIARRGKK